MSSPPTALATGALRFAAPCPAPYGSPLAILPLQAGPRTPLRSRANDLPPPEEQPVVGDRVIAGLVAYYPLLLGAGPNVVDRGPERGRLDLRLSGAVGWLPGGHGLLLEASEDAPAVITRRTARSLHSALTATNAFSFEVWVKAAGADQEGPARIVTFSENPWQRNFMLGVEGDQIRVRVRTTDSNENGGPDIVFKEAVSTELEHYIVTFGGGTVALYRNGVLFGAEQRSGDLSNWDDSYSLLFGNEVEGERPWLGELFGVAIYDRALSDAEAAQNFAAGPDPAAGGSENRPPLVDAGEDRIVIQPTSTITLAGVARDDGRTGQPLDVSWSVLDGPGEVSFEDAGTAYASARFTAPGDYRLELRADDGVAASADEALVSVVETSRVGRELLAFYPFVEGRGEAAYDHSGRPVAPTLELLRGAEWLAGGNGVLLSEDALLHSITGATDLRHALVSRNAFTFEVWAQPQSTVQNEAALLSFSERSWRERNFTIVQDREGFVAALRTTETEDDGRPILRAAESFQPGLGQYVATWDGSMLRLYRNGEMVEARHRQGDLSDWDPDLPLVVGAEGDGYFGWAGEVHLLAVYGRALSQPEIERNFRVGGREILSGGAPVANEAPVADAGDDRLVSLPNNFVRLRAKADDDGLPRSRCATPGRRYRGRRKPRSRSRTRSARWCAFPRRATIYWSWRLTTASSSCAIRSRWPCSPNPTRGCSTMPPGGPRRS